MTTATKKPTALETMKREMQKRQQAQVICVDKYDIVKPYYRERYLILTKEIAELKSAIDKWEELHA